VRLDLEEAAVADVLAAFSSLLGVEVEVAPEVQGEVTVKLDDATAAAALDEVCRQIGCSWTILTTPGGARLVAVSVR